MGQRHAPPAQQVQVAERVTFRDGHRTVAGHVARKGHTYAHVVTDAGTEVRVPYQLLARDLPHRRRLLTGELVRAVARETGGGLGLGQAVVGIGFEGGGDGCLVLREPCLRVLDLASCMLLGRGRGHNPIICRVRITARHPPRVISYRR